MLKATVHSLLCFECPECKELSPPVQQVANRTWYCLTCGQGVRVDLNGNDVHLSLIDVAHNTLVLLEQGDVHFVVQGWVYAPRGTLPTISHEEQRYFYEDKLCPANILGCVQVLTEGHPDIHGVAKYITSVVVPRKFNAVSRTASEWAELFPYLRKFI